MNNLWSYIQGLSLSACNQTWLAEQLIAASRQPKRKVHNKTKDVIPESFRCDPYEISPSGDPFFGDKRNVEYIRKRIKDSHADESKVVKTIHGHQELDKFLDSL